MIIDELLVGLGFEVNDSEKVKAFQKTTDQLTGSTLALVAAVGLAAAGLSTLVMKVAGQLDDMGDFADVVDMSVKEVDALGRVAATNDSSLSAMKSTIQGLSGVIGQAALGIGRGAKIFETLGFNAKNASGKVKGVYDVLGEVADRMKGMTAPEKLALTSKMGIDSSLIPLLSKGRAELMRLKAEAESFNPLDEKDYQSADRIMKLWERAKLGVERLSRVIAVQLFPLTERLLTSWNSFFEPDGKSGKSWFTASLEVFIAAMVATVDWISRILDYGKRLLEWLGQYRVLTWALVSVLSVLLAYQVGAFFLAVSRAIAWASTALFAFNSGAILSVALVGGLVLAIGILVDELVNFYEGNDTVLGQLAQEYPWAINAAKVAVGLLTAAFVALKWGAISSVASTLVSVASLAAGWVLAFGSMAVSVIAATWPILLIVGALGAIGYALYYLWNNFDEITTFIGEKWSQVLELFKTAASGSLNFVLELFNKVKEGVLGFIDTVDRAITSLGKFFGLSADSPEIKLMASSSSGGQVGGGLGSGVFPGFADNYSYPGSNVATNSTVNSTTISGTNINITSPDPQKAGEAVQRTLQDLSKRSIRNGQSVVQQ